MFINNTQTPIRQFKTKVNLTINPKIYEQFKQVAEKNLQPKSWVIERMMKSYILETNKSTTEYHSEEDFQVRKREVEGVVVCGESLDVFSLMKLIF